MATYGLRAGSAANKRRWFDGKPLILDRISGLGLTYAQADRRPA
jgi:hypothetical protein